METLSSQNKYKNKIITIPNILSFLRICLVPIIVWMYIGKQNYLLTGLLVIFSGFTDIVDGMIARKFNMISDVGKVLDPIADKLTQAIVVLLLISRFPLMLIPFLLGIAKEIFMAVSGYMVVKKCGIVLGANWHGKVATVFLVTTIALHLLWYNITSVFSNISIIASSIAIALSLALYVVRNFSYLNGKMLEK